MNKKIGVLLIALFFVAMYAKGDEPDLNLILPTESKFMTLLGDEAKEKIVEQCNPELKKLEKPEDIFSVQDLEEYYAYEEKIGTDDFVWLISPVLEVHPPLHKIILLRKKNKSYKILAHYYTKTFGGERPLNLHFSNIQIIKGRESAKGFIYFTNTAEIESGTSYGDSGEYWYPIKKYKGHPVGYSIGMYFRFEDEPTEYNLIEENSATYPSPEEWNYIDIEASNYLWDEKAPLKYALCNAFDGNPATSYVENTKDDLMRVEIWLGETVDKMAVINGYAQSESLYLKNNRAKYVDDYFLLKDNTLGYQYIPCEETNVDFTEIYHGEKYNDTCIAEINFFYNGSWLFGDIDE